MIEDRFWSKVNKDGPVSAHRPDLGPCWLWTAGQKGKGYGEFRAGGRMGRVVRAHRFAYELLVGSIPTGMTLDHLCRIRHCVNPAHLEPVTSQVNTRRGNSGLWQREKTHCPSGHPYDAENTRLYKGWRNCRACQWVSNQRYRQRLARAG